MQAIRLRTCLLVLPFMVAGCERDEPTYEGKGTSHWLAMSKDANAATRESAIDPLRALSPNDDRALPALRELLSDSNGKVRVFAAGAVWDLAKDPAVVQPLITALADRDSDTHAYAAMTLCDIGPSAKAALPALQAAIDAEKKGVARDSMKSAVEIINDGKQIRSARTGKPIGP